MLLQLRLFPHDIRHVESHGAVQHEHDNIFPVAGERKLSQLALFLMHHRHFGNIRPDGMQIQSEHNAKRKRSDEKSFRHIAPATFPKAEKEKSDNKNNRRIQPLFHIAEMHSVFIFERCRQKSKSPPETHVIDDGDSGKDPEPALESDPRRPVSEPIKDTAPEHKCPGRKRERRHDIRRRIIHEPGDDKFLRRGHDNRRRDNAAYKKRQEKTFGQKTFRLRRKIGARLPRFLFSPAETSFEIRDIQQKRNKARFAESPLVASR